MSYEVLYENHVTGPALDDRKHEIELMLKNHICEVTFVKVDGTLRTMICTTNGSHIPAQPVKMPKKAANLTLDQLLESPKPKAKPAHNISVWCMDNNAWRSFKVANVTHVKVIDGN
jgi:hypothetical protein